MAHVEEKVSSERSANGVLKVDEQNSQLKNGSLEIVQKVLVELKINSTNKLFLAILEKLFNADKSSKDTDLQKINIIVMFLKMLEESSYDNYGDVFHEFDKCFMSKELRKITIKNSPVKNYFTLGQGDFGTVVLGRMGDSFVAVKQLKCEHTNTTLLQEAKVMAGLDHKNVVKMVAFQKNPMKIIMEHIRGGNLRTAVSTHLISGSGILKAMYDVATGMEYIAGKNIIHRDLDANNIFVDLEKVCKIGDFGLARYVGYSPKLEFKEQNGLNVLFLTAPESRASDIYTTKSDVWSFGILVLDMYEIAEDLSFDVIQEKMRELITNLITKGVVSFPRLEGCPTSLFDYTMEEILTLEPSKRPTFTSIKEKLGGLI